MAEAAFGAIRVCVGDLGPSLVIQLAIEAGKHDCALRMTRDRRHEARRRFIGAGRAECDHWTARGGATQSRDLAFGESDLPCGAVDKAALSEDVRPLADRDI